ncbi:hypothetical protein ACI65C_003534 [Semiaphis heraclei]
MSYYKDRLGFDPDEPTANGDGTATTGPRKSKRGYEENLSKFKDERDAIQKKTFTKWVNKHLKKANRHVGDLFIDLQDGLNLISLLEVLSGDQLPRERGKLRFHMLQNVQMALEYLRFKKIKLVNIRAEDIVDGNPKLTLGLIWTIILHFQHQDAVIVKICYCRVYVSGVNPDFPPSSVSLRIYPYNGGMLCTAVRCLCNPRPPPASAERVTPTLWLVQGPRRPKDLNAPGQALFIWICGARSVRDDEFLARSNVGSTSVGAGRCYRNTLRVAYNNIVIFW